MFLLSSDFALSVILSNSGLCYIREAVTPASQSTRLRQEVEYQNTKKSRVPAKSMVAVKSRAPVAHQSIVGSDSQKRALQPFCGGFEHGLQSRYPRSSQTMGSIKKHKFPVFFLYVPSCNLLKNK